MNIKDLASKLKQNNIEFNLIEESLNYPVLSFNIMSNKFIFFYRENFIRRTKFHKRYNTFLEITANEKTEVLILKIKIEEVFSCRYCIDENKIYSNVSAIKEDQIIDFINKLKNNLIK